MVIDGIRDLVYDINSPSEATCVISKLMQWTDEYQIHLHTILHRTKAMKTPVGISARKSTTKRKRSFKLKKTKMTATSAKWKVCTPVPKTFCHSLSASMTNHFPNFCRTMCRQKERRSSQAGTVLPFYKDIHEAIHRKASNWL